VHLFNGGKDACVYGFFGPLIPLDLGTVSANPNKRKRRSRERLFGVVVSATGEHKWMVHFDNGEQHECTSNTLVVAPASASLPPQGFRPHLPPLPQQPGQQPQEEEKQDESDDPDQEEEEEEEGGGSEHGEEEGAERPEGEQGEQEGAGTNRQISHSQRLQAARDTIAGQLGHEVHVKKGREQLVWTVVEGSDPENPLQERSGIGLRGIDLHRLPKATCLARMFLHLTFADYTLELDKLNNAIAEENNDTTTRVKAFTLPEFLTGLGLFIGASGYGEKGKRLWTQGDK
jgi:hypothetical protein